MPNDYLVHVFILGVATVAAWAPPRRPQALARAALLAGRVVHEVPHRALPFQAWTVGRLRNLRYGQHRRQRLDVLRRRGRPTGGPVLVHFHGGGYLSGSKNWEARGLLHHFAERGWVCISASYRLRPCAGLEEHIADARAAMAWARAHAHEHGGDPAKVVMAGSSAGAHLTSLYALASTPQERPAVAVCLYGYYGRYHGRGADEKVPSSPLALDAAAAPAFLVAHGSLDSYTPASSARALAEKVRAESAEPVVHVELPGGQHAFDLLRSWRLSAVMAGLDVLAAHLHLDARPAGAPTDVMDRR